MLIINHSPGKIEIDWNFIYKRPLIDEIIRASQKSYCPGSVKRYRCYFRFL